MDVSIIIVSYNTKGLLADCLNSIVEKTHGVEYEVIVVDNDSKDGTQEMLKAEFHWVRLIENKENLGFGKANNLGMKNAFGRYIFLLNSDTILVNNAVKEFFDYAENNPRFGVLGSILLNNKIQPCHSYGKFPTQMRLIKDMLAKYLRFLKDTSCINPSKILEPISVEYVTGADMWITKETFEKTGGFDNDFFMYFEEVDWQYRMAKAGMNRIIIPGPEIIHLEGGSDTSGNQRWTASRLKRFYTSQKIYQKKHFNKLTYPIFKSIYIILNTPSLIMLTFFKNEGGYLKIIKLQ